MHKLASQYFAIPLVLLLLPAISYSQNSYQVQIDAKLSKDKENTQKLESTFVSAEIFLEEVTTGSHPYAEAAFLEHASNLIVGYFDSDFTSTIYDSSTDGIALGATYIEPNSLLIFQVGYQTSTADIKNGASGDSEYDGTYVGIGKYISENSAIMVNYFQLDGETNILFPLPTTTYTIKRTDINVQYKIVEQLQDGAAFNFQASLTSSDVDINATSETNTVIEFSGDYYYNQSINVGASLEMNSGDDKGDEGKTLGLNLNMFLTPSFAVFVEFNQFNADNISGDDSDEVVLGGVARF